jgi:hypothetical protein
MCSSKLWSGRRSEFSTMRYLGNRIDDALALASLYGCEGKNESREIAVSTPVHRRTGPFGGATPIGLALRNASPDTSGNR